MGGPKGINASEEWRVTIVANRGIKMRAVPRPCEF